MHRDFGIAAVAEREAVRPGVIADPMALVVGALDDCASGRFAQLVADDKECRADPVPAEDVQDARGSVRFGTVVKRQRELKHPDDSTPRADIQM